MGKNYNIGGRNKKQNLEAVKTICTQLEELEPTKPPGVACYENLITYVTDRGSSDRHYAIDVLQMQ